MPEPPIPPALLSTADAVQYLGRQGLKTSQDSLYRWVRSHPDRFPHSVQDPGRRWRFAPTDLDAILASKAAPEDAGEAR